MIIKISFLYLSFQTKQLRNQFHSAPEKGLKIRSGAEANYVGFELNRQKTEKPTSLNICCSHTSQLVTNNPPDRVVMLKIVLTLHIEYDFSLKVFFFPYHSLPCSLPNHPETVNCCNFLCLHLCGRLWARIVL